MKVIDIINSRNKPFPSFEFVPPLKGSSLDNINASLDSLMEFKPSFVNITFHNEITSFSERPDGSVAKKLSFKRPGTVALAGALMRKFDVEVVPHIVCSGFNKWETENELIDLSYLGIQNVMALRGDCDKNHKKFIPTEDGYMYAQSLVKHIKNLNNGVYIDPEVKSPVPTDFCIGVAGYPEKHVDSSTIFTDILNLKQKVDAGADYIVTQMFFDNQHFYDFVRACRDCGINVPIIPGLKPLSSLAQVGTLPDLFHLTFPDALLSEIGRCRRSTDIVNLGIEWCAYQSKELIKFGVPVIHYFTMEKSGIVKSVLEKVF